MIFFEKNLKIKSVASLMETLGDNFKGKKGKKGPQEFYCDKCDFKCCKKYSWERHLTTTKHQKMTKDDKIGAFEGKKGQNETFTCEFCNKEYKHRQGLWKHKKLCFIPENKDHNYENMKSNKLSIDDKDALIIQLLKQNAKLMEILENGTTNHSL